MRVSINVTNHSWPGDPRDTGVHLTEVARAADEGGLDTVWVPDHLLQTDPTVEAGDREMLEAYTTLGFLAARTERVRLGTLVAGVTHREPALLVKAVDTVAALSGGRAWLGIGAGYQAAEAEAMGLPAPSTAERFERLEETLRIAARMWAGDTSPFEGEHYRLARPESRPRPDPRPPVLVGGTGPKRTLRLVARYADACNVFDVPDDGATVRRTLEVLAGHCADVGRPYAEIERTMATRLGDGESGAAFADRMARAAGWGVDHAVVLSSRPWTAAGIATLAAAVPALAGVTAPR